MEFEYRGPSYGINKCERAGESGFEHTLQHGDKDVESGPATITTANNPRLVRINDIHYLIIHINDHRRNCYVHNNSCADFRGKFTAEFGAKFSRKVILRW